MAGRVARELGATWRSRRARRIAFVAVGLALIPILLIGLGLSYLMLAEWRSPSDRVAVVIGGERIYLEQPFEVVTPMSEPGSAPEPGEIEEPAGEGDAFPDERGTAEVPLPPLRLEIPAIDVGANVVLADNDNLPRIPVAGWYFKSAFPATAGNLVLIGHVDGAAAIFGDLHTLDPGDEVRVMTATKIHTYVITDVTIVDDTAVEALAPTSEPVITLITCAGEWNPVVGGYDQRIVARGYYASVSSRNVAGS